MAQNSINLHVQKNADGFELQGGATPRKLTVTGGDATITGGGSAIITFPTSTATLATLALTETLTNKTINGSSNTLTVLAGTQLSGQVPLANGGTGVSLSDPNADRLWFWDDSAGAIAWLTLGTGLSITGTTINVTSAGIGGATGATDNAIIRADGAGGVTIQTSPATINDAGGISTTIANSGNSVALSLTQNDTTNNPNAATITNAGTGYGLSIVQNGAGDAFLVQGTARIRMQETTAPTGTSGYGKMWVSSTDSRLHFMDDSGNDYVVSERNSNVYRINVISGTYYVENPVQGYFSSNASLDTLWAAIVTDIGSDPAVIEFGVGTFNVTDGLDIFKDNIHIKGQGMGLTTLQANGTGGVETAPIIEYSSTQAGAAHTLTADADAGDLNVTVSLANSAAYSVGDIILLTSDKRVDNEFASRLQGELHRVKAVDTGTGIITIGGANDGDMVYEDHLTADAAKIYRMTGWVQNVTVEGITFTDTATSRATLGIGQVAFQFIDNLTVRDCEFSHLWHTSLWVKQCMNVNIYGNYFHDAEITSGLHYGVSIAGAIKNCNIVSNVFENFRHSVTGGAGNSTYTMGRPRNISVTGNVSLAAASGHFDMHQGAVGLNFVGNTCLGDDTSAAGIITRSPATITGNNIVACRSHGIALQARAHGSIVSGNNIEFCQSGIYVERQVQQVTITGNSIHDCIGDGIKLTRGTSTSATMTIASPAVVSYTDHNLVPGSQITWSTTGALPTGVSPTTVYYVIEAGWDKDSFQFSATYNGAAVNTSGSQSGTHTIRMAGGNQSIISDNNVYDNGAYGLFTNSQRELTVTDNRFSRNSEPINHGDGDSVSFGWLVTGNRSHNHTSSDIPTINGINHIIRGNIGFMAETYGYLAITGARTLDITDHIVNCTANTFTVTLPTAVGIKGREYVIKNTGTGVITIDGNSSETIDGMTTFLLDTQYMSLTIMSDGANWIII